MDIDRQEEQGGNNGKASVVGSKAEEMPPKPLATIRLLECEVLKHPVLCIVLNLPSFSLKDPSVLFIQMNISIE